MAANSGIESEFSSIVLPPDLEWYEELGGQRTGWVCEVNGPGWWHVEELELELPACGVQAGEA